MQQGCLQPWLRYLTVPYSTRIVACRRRQITTVLVRVLVQYCTVPVLVLLTVIQPAGTAAGSSSRSPCSTEPSITDTGTVVATVLYQSRL